MVGGIKQSVDVTNADFSGKEPEPQPQEGVIYKTVANHDFEQPVILPEVGLVPGWIHRSGITFPEEPPTQIFQGEGIGYEITDKPASLEGSVTPAGSVAGDKCMHFYDFNYNSSAQEDGVWNEVYLYSDGLPVTAGTEYHVAFEAMVGDIPDTNETRQGRFRFGILYYDNAGNQIGLMDNYIVSVGDSASPSNMQRPVDRWKEYTSSWKAPEGAVTAKIFINTTPLWVANLFIDNMEFFTMDGDQKQQMDVNNADFSVEKQEIPVDLAPGWVLLNPVVEGTTGYEVVAKPVDLSETAGQGSALKLFDNSETEQIALASRAMPVKAGVAYQAEFDVLVSGSMQVGMLFFDAEHPIPSMDSILSRDVQTVQNSDQAAQWKTVEHRAVAPEGAAYVALVAMTETAGKAEKAFVDNVQLWYEFSGSDVQTPLYRMEDGTGVAGSVVDVAGEVVVTSVPYINAELSDKTVTVLVGLYDETGRMVAIQKKENAVMKQGTDGEILLEIEVPEVAEGSYIKTIVVDGLDTLSPVTKGRLD